MDKIKLCWSFLVYHLLYIQDTPDSKYNRQWRRWIEWYRKDSYVAISFEKQLTQFNGLPMGPRAVSIKQIGLEFNPKKWCIKQDHTYYDGNHCQYEFGPFSYYTSGSKNCEKCDNES